MSWDHNQLQRESLQWFNWFLSSMQILYVVNYILHAHTIFYDALNNMFLKLLCDFCLPFHLGQCSFENCSLLLIFLHNLMTYELNHLKTKGRQNLLESNISK